jgi:catechol-2,3-dioxygenase
MSTRTGICHVGIQSQDPQALAAFYRDVLGMAILGGSAPDSPLGATAFLSSQPGEEDHEIAIFEAPRFRHIAFRVASLAALRTLYGQIIERGLPIKLAFNHGVSLAFYFDDPDGNMIEIYWATGVACPQPHADPVDLARPEADLLQAVTVLAGRAGAATLA